MTSAAHFVLTSPPSMYEQNALGDPQKAPPCGDQGNAVATGEVMSVQGGDTITVTIEETIFHPGHYRIALALDDGIFPEEPPVTPGTTDCGSAPIDPAPAFPVLADGLWEHSEPLAGPQSIDITIPEGVSCTHCTLQVIQFMSNHGLNNPGGCYYHHCATIAVEPSAAETGATTAPGDETGTEPTGGGPFPGSGTAADDSGGPGQTEGELGGSSSTGGVITTGIATNTDGDGVPADDDGSGCSCAAPTGRSEGVLGLLFGLVGLVALRRRRS